MMILGIAMLALSLSLDAFAAAFAYGCKKITIPPLSAFIITLICTATAGLSFVIGTAFATVIPAWVAAGLAFAILFIIGVAKLLDSITKSIVRKYTQISKELKMSLLNFKFILQVYADPEAADADVSKSISSHEAIVLAVSLSLDGLAVGFGAALMGFNVWIFLMFSLIANSAAILLGGKVGNKVSQNLPFNISWVAGAVLIALAFAQLI